MSSRSWQSCLRQTLNRLQNPDRPTRIAIVGIGHELRGDDSIGIAIVRRLRRRAHRDPWLLVVDGGCAPENCTSLLRRFKPDLVLLIDAAWMDSLPGTVRWIDWQATGGISASTHTLPLQILSAYLISEFQCEVALIGIQPANTAIGTPLSAEVQQAGIKIVKSLQLALQQ